MVSTIHHFAEEAAKCRAQADEFAGKPEQPFLLRLSEAFEDLALQDLQAHQNLMGLEARATLDSKRSH